MVAGVWQVNTLTNTLILPQVLFPGKWGNLDALSVWRREGIGKKLSQFLNRHFT